MGALLGSIFDCINYTWIRELPTEFFYISGSFWFSIFGGNAVYYLGTYGYGASVATDENRAKVLGRFDAIELAGKQFLENEIKNDFFIPFSSYCFFCGKHV